MITDPKFYKHKAIIFNYLITFFYLLTRSKVLQRNILLPFYYYLTEKY